MVSRYTAFIRQLIKADYKVIVYGCYGSGSHSNSVGSEIERNLAAAETNRSLKAFCRQSSIPFFTFNNLFVDQDYRSRTCLMQDDAHLPETGHGGVEIKALLMGNLWESCSSLSSTSRQYPLPSYQGNCHNHCNIVIANLGTPSQCDLNWNAGGFLHAPKLPITSLYFDLWSHHLVSGLAIHLADEALLQSISDLFLLRLDGRELSSPNMHLARSILRLTIEQCFAKYIQISSTPVYPDILSGIRRMLPRVITMT